jgi:deoxyribodipyrimidine photo-lyase
MAWQRPDFERYESLPEWARATLTKHESDPRPQVYDHADFEAARTHDEIWNAAQTQLLREGRIHNYLRMLWGKNSESTRRKLRLRGYLDRYAPGGQLPLLDGSGKGRG